LPHSKVARVTESDATIAHEQLPAYAGSLHLFCAPRDLKFTIERWIGFRIDRLAKDLKKVGGAAAPPDRDAGKFQAGGFHHRMRQSRPAVVSPR
jgi:hypothetical protein